MELLKQLAIIPI